MQGLLEGVALGIEEKQLEMEEVNKKILFKQTELADMGMTIRRKQMLLDITSREVEECMHRVKAERERMEEEQIKEEKPTNCTESPTWQEKQVKKELRISGLKVTGVFTLCGLIASLGWGGVTSVLVITA